MERPLFEDTPLEIERLMLARLRQMSPAQRAHMVGELTRSAQMMALAGLRQKYPQASERELRLRMAIRQYGEDLVRKLCAKTGEVFPE